AQGLFRGTAKLPFVNVKKPARAMGKNTEECIQSGLYHGTVGQIKEVLRVMRKEMKGKPKVIATGGGAALFQGAGLFDKVHPTLVLDGIMMAHSRRGEKQ